jgi:hypothetical protein
VKIENVNIFDPMSSTALTVTRWKREGKTRYEIDFDVSPTPIVTGDNAEERIARILKSAANLDERFKLPNVLLTSTKERSLSPESAFFL